MSEITVYAGQMKRQLANTIIRNNSNNNEQIVEMTTRHIVAIQNNEIEQTSLHSRESTLFVIFYDVHFSRKKREKSLFTRHLLH